MKHKITETEIENILMKNRLENSERELSRLPLEREQRFMNAIREGRYREVGFMDYNILEQSMGKSTKDRKKMFEYITVAAIAMGARAAIDGGLKADEAFDISDAMLGRLETAQTVDEMHEIVELAGVLYAHQVLKTKQSRGSYQIEQCKNYISRHIFKKIQLEKIAEYVGLNPHYLSGLFSKSEGITIEQYIQREKMDVACNLLKYSDRSIAEIAQYIGIQSQSNFAALFKKWKGQTPSEYRNQNKTKVFTEKER